MRIVLKHGNKLDGEYFKINCKCGCEFICSEHDFSTTCNNFLEKFGKRVVLCPDCGNKIYSTVGDNRKIFIDNNYWFSSVYDSISVITKEEYDKVYYEGENSF